MSENQKQVKQIIKAMYDILDQLNEIGLAAENHYFGPNLRMGINGAINQKKGFHRELYGLKPKPSEEEQNVRRCELYLEKQKAILDFYERESKRYSTGKGGVKGISISPGEFDRLRENVKHAEDILKHAKGEKTSYQIYQQEARERARKNQREQEAEREHMREALRELRS